MRLYQQEKGGPYPSLFTHTGGWALVDLFCLIIYQPELLERQGKRYTVNDVPKLYYTCVVLLVWTPWVDATHSSFLLISCLSSMSGDQEPWLGAAAEWLRHRIKRAYGCYGWFWVWKRPHHGSLLALQNKSFIVTRVPALIWPGKTHKAKLCTWNKTAFR